MVQSIDNPEELSKWGMGIQLIEEQYLTSNEELSIEVYDWQGS